MDLVERVKAVLLTPQVEWPVIAREPDTASMLLARYVAILAAIPAVAGFIGGSLIGFYTPIARGLLAAIVSYLLAFVAVLIVALIVNALAPSFGGERNFVQALKLAVYSHIPYWLAGIFLLVPGLSYLTILGLYGFYLLWTGLPVLMRAPSDRALAYACAVTGCALLLALLFALL
jgi:Yip1 domain